jgi:hypothetical protein
LEAFGKENSDLVDFTTLIHPGDIIAHHRGGIHKGFSYGWEENGSPTVSFLGAHFMKDKCVLLSILVTSQS